MKRLLSVTLFKLVYISWRAQRINQLLNQYHTHVPAALLPKMLVFKVG